MGQKIITLSSDFGVQSQGVGIMEGVVTDINPDAKVIHLMHGLPDFNIFYAARTMETLNYMPIGYHVCVVDPGVGTERKPIIIETGRGDFLVGPDNGVLIPATRFLEGIKKVVEITNKEYMRLPVSPIFHGRDIFTPAAAHLSKGVAIEKFGEELNENDLVKAAYEEAIVENDKVNAKIISINKFGSLHLNITHSEWDKIKSRKGDKIEIDIGGKKLILPFCVTFGEVEKGEALILKDDYGRIEVSINQGSFAKKFGCKIEDEVIIQKID